MSDKPIDLLQEIWGDIRTSFSKKPIPAENLPYCGHETTEERLESKLWEYAERSMSETDAEPFWKQVQGCKYCLQKLLNIQQAINQTSQEKGYALERIKEIIKPQKSINVLQIALNWVKDSLELISTTGQILVPEPAPVVRGTVFALPEIIRISKEFKRGAIVMEIQKKASRTCDLQVKFEPVKAEVCPRNLRISLFANKKLLASYIAHENRVVFNDINPNNYRIALAIDTELLGEVLLNIE